ncbi:MAG: NAD(P)/FAD-dependent oxidoreductase [Acidimicrobiia bacterium]|nr:NAD(P)/FAD-dependent oxidoreductase [Acidimicrobiia bacterium]
MHTDVVVVGGGPAGSAAALWAMRLGLECVITDKASFPRDKTCGDGLTATALREIETLGIDVRPHVQPVRRTVLTGPYGKRIELPLVGGTATPSVMCAVMARAELDRMLLEAAAAGGAKVRDGCAVTALTPGRDSVEVTLGSGRARETIRARWVIGADGAYSTVRRAVAGRADGRLPGMHAIRQYLDAPASDVLSVYFPAELLPGYGWIFPMPGGGVNIGVGVQRRAADCGVVCREALSSARGKFTLSGLGRLYRDFLHRPDVVERIGDVDPDDRAVRAWAWPIPSDPDLGCVGAGRALLVGDAARVVDPMTGEGIGQALVSARLAAESIAAAHVTDGPAAVTAYRRRLDLHVGRDLRFARFMLGVMKHRRAVEWGFGIAGSTAWTRRNVARWMYEDYPRAYVFTPDRWGRFSMRGRGAY